MNRRPPEPALTLVKTLLGPWRWLTGPKFYGLANIPRDRPVLLAGNHTIEGMLDLPLMVLGLWDEIGLFAHGMADHLHFRIPGWRDLLRAFGAVDGTRKNCRELMEARESVLVYPGGAREVYKRKGEKYKLFWEGRIGFVRLAAEHAYPIVPFSAVGAEECYDIMVDAGDLLDLPVVGDILRHFVPRSEVLPPLVKGAGLSPLPRPERFYFSFGPPIETARDRACDEAFLADIQLQTRRAVEDGIGMLLSERERDPDRKVVARALHRWSRQRTEKTRRMR